MSTQSKKSTKGKVVTILFALIKMSGIGITEASGKLGGSVFSRTKGGVILRNRVVGTNPQTVAQQQIRAIFGAISSAWRSLTQTERDAWNAITEDYPYQNRLGETKILSGKALFQKLNNNLLFTGGSLATNPSTPQGTNAPVNIVSYVPEVILGVFNMALNVNLATAGDNTSIVVIEATPPLSEGVKNANPKFLKISQGVVTSSNLTVTPATLGASYVAVFGDPQVGAQIQIRLSVVNPSTGEKSAVLKDTAVVI